VDFETWEPIYDEILADMGYSRREDERSAQELAKILRRVGSISLVQLRKSIAGERIVVTGGALRQEDVNSIPRFRIIATGQSIPLLQRNGRSSAVLVTDLDGDLKSQKVECRKGAIAVVHAHGNNIDLQEEVEDFKGKLVGTCQCRPVLPLYNFGGFTDGDRAVALALAMGATKVLLAGFRFDEPMPNTESKRKKLVWAKRIIDLLSKCAEIRSIS
jgi:uncharacterized Rossmann fold enzyme